MQLDYSIFLTFSKMSILPACEVQWYQILNFKRFYMGKTYIRLFLLTHRRVFEAFYWYFLNLSTTWSFPMKVDISKIFIIIFLGSNDFKNATFYFYCLPVGIFWYNLLFGQLISMKKSVAPLEWWMCKNFVWNVRKC